VFILNLLFKKRKSFNEIFTKDDMVMEFFAKILKPVFWWIIIGVFTHSVNQPIGSHTSGFRGQWPVDLMWYCVHNSTDAARKLAQYRISVDW
jgi:hypothetical protein